MNQPSFLRNLFFDKSPTLFSLFCTGLLIFGVASFLCFRQFETARNNSIHADNIAANLLATVLAQHDKAGTEVLMSYAQRPLLIKAVKARDLAAIYYHLEEMKRNNPEMDLIFLTDKDGTIRANYPIFREAIGQNVSDRDWYQGVSARWEPYTSAVFQLIVADKALAAATAVPIRDEDGEVIGVLGNSHRLDYMASLVQSAYLNSETTVNIIDQKGQLLFSNKYPFRDRITDYTWLPVIQQAIKGNEHLVETPGQSSSDGKSYLTLYPVGHVGWTVVVERTHEDILRSTYRGFFETAAIALLLFSLAGTLLFYQRKVVLLRKTKESLDAEQKLQEAVGNERDFSAAILDTAGALVIVLDKEGKITRFNRACEEITGYLSEEVLGRVFVDFLVPPEEMEGVRQTWKALCSGNFPNQHENHWVSKNGTRRLIAWSNTAITRSDGEINYIIGTGVDITERKRAEEAMRESAQRLQFALETCHIGAWDLDLVDHTAFRSIEHDRVFGYTAFLPEWTYEMFLDHVLAEDRAAVDAKFRHAVETRSGWSFECRIRRIDGEVRWIWAAGRISADAAGAARRMVGIVQDITERKQAEKVLNDLNETLEKAVKERTAEIIGVNRALEERARQLRQLAGELTMTEQRERKRLAKILHDGLQQSLAAAKMRAGTIANTYGGNVAQDAVYVEKILAETIQMSRSLSAELSPPVLYERGLAAGLEWLARVMRERHGLNVTCAIRDKVQLPEDITVLTFESIRELLFNAVKHSQVSAAEVSLGVTDGHLRITVSDAGIGFEPGSLGSSGGTGGGLGLFSIRERLALLGGYLSIDSTPGRGSCFTLTVPHRGLDNPTVPVKQAPEGQIRVLLADDHRLFREGLERLCKQEPDINVIGYAETGEQAVEQAEKLQPDVILMDINMSGMNGIDATAAIHCNHPDIKIIGLSVYSDEISIKAMRKAGAVDYKSKDCQASELVMAIRAAAQEKSKECVPSGRLPNFLTPEAK